MELLIDAHCSLCSGLAVVFLFKRGQWTDARAFGKGKTRSASIGCRERDRFDILEEFENNCTPRLRREIPPDHL